MNKKNFKKFNIALVFVFALVSIMPFVTFAQVVTPGANAGIGGIMDAVTTLIGSNFIKFVFALAFAYFFWGVVQYALYPDDEAKKEKGRQYMVWGIIALTVMFTVYGLIRVLKNTFNLNDNSGSIQRPTLQQ